MRIRVFFAVKDVLAFVVLGFLVVGCSTSDSQLRSAKNMLATPLNDGRYVVDQPTYNKLVVAEYMASLGSSDHDVVAQKLRSSNYVEIRSEFHNMSHHAAGSELADMADSNSVAIANRRDLVNVVLAENDMVAVRYKILGTHQANFYGIPATGKDIEIDAGALFWMADGKITKGWFMADEAGLLKQIGQPLPARKDGRWEAGPTVLPVMTGDDHLAMLLKNPIDSLAYRNKLTINSYKSKNPPAELKLTPEQYGTGVRRGFTHLTDSASAAAAEQYPFRGAFPDRVDMIAQMLSDDKWVMILFRLTATNTESLFGIPALNNPISAYEFGFMRFDGERWAIRWFFGDDLGMLLQMGGPQDYWFSGDQ